MCKVLESFNRENCFTIDGQKITAKKAGNKQRHGKTKKTGHNPSFLMTIKQKIRLLLQP